MAKPALHLRLQSWGLRHVEALQFSLHKLISVPLASALTLLVIGIALTLPGSLYLLLSNVQTITPHWQDSGQVSVFLRTDAAAEKLPRLAAELGRDPRVAQIQTMTPEQALAEFRRHSGFGEALDVLSDNPLPATLLVTPTADHRSPEALSALVTEWQRLDSVASVEVDLLWLQRLSAIARTLERGTLLLALLLAAAVLLVIGNTIRLDIQNRREEIEVAKLVGATNGFIRRPFLYGGLWLGLGGALLAITLSFILLTVLNGPIRELAGLYGSPFALSGLSIVEMLGLLLLGSALGLVGAWLTVARHLKDIEP